MRVAGMAGLGKTGWQPDSTGERRCADPRDLIKLGGDVPIRATRSS
jgi:hypothetical protein